MKNRLFRLARNDSGATAIEYGLIAGLIAVAVVGLITTVGTDLGGVFTGISGGLTDATTP
ncbi:Flp family type IVb pilin [Paracoccus liaowanqingii]|uniref:Flp family type IVb pilin n=1 Tax=Paracoccus liaowanqingii TaxID=2560053 RepID=A0A4Z1BXV1_9RHOB|nr:Flp family type IVb pilin [Paracoccus liaowanqingii]TGN62504.1 Flp family type IVb pilin [Paracoccus liaowanqingii]